MLAQRTALVLLMALGASSEFLFKKEPEQDAFEADFTANPDAVRAEIYGDSSEKNPSMELLRFVTGYNAGLDSIVDVTPYTPLFMKPMGLKMYGGIQAQGKNDPTLSSEAVKTVFYQPNKDLLDQKNLSGEELNTCTEQQKSEEHGWSLSADLIFFKHMENDPDAMRAAPREILSLASGYHSTHAIGAVTMHAGKTDLFGKVVTDDNIDLTGVTNLVAYNCEDGPEVVVKAAMGDYIAAKAEKYYQDGKDLDKVERLAQDVAKFMLEGKLVPVTPIRADDAIHGAAVFGQQNVEAFFDEKEVTPAKDMPVYYADHEVYSTFNVDVDGKGHQMPWNMSMPFKRVGVVVWVAGNKMGMKIDEPCRPRVQNDYKVQLVVPKSAKLAEEVTEFIQSALDLGKLRASVDFGVSATTEQQRFHLPENDKFGSLKLPEVTPMISQVGNYPGAVPIPQSGEPIVQKEFEFADGIKHVQNDAPLCVVAERKSGRVIERKFDTPLMEGGDRAILKVVITGNGWEHTQEQCGEYCDIKYQLRINDQDPITLSEWRDDCAQNPNSLQEGNWYQARNGGCPGAVEPGITTDITRLLKNDQSNTMALDILVYDPESEHYVPYTNIKGWLFNEEAALMVSMSLHVYEKQIATFFGQRPYAQLCSVAEQQLQVGGKYGDHNTVIEGTLPIPVKEETSLLQQFLPRMDERSLEYVDHVMQNPEAANKGPEWAMKLMQATQSAEPGNDKCYNFVSEAPFYATKSVVIAHKIRMGNAIRVPVLKKVVIKGKERYHTVPLDLLEVPFHWRQVGLQLRVEGPDGAEVQNHWPRVGSVGLEFSRDSQAINTHDVQDPQARPGLEAGASRVGILGALLATLLALVA